MNGLLHRDPRDSEVTVDLVEMVDRLVKLDGVPMPERPILRGHLLA